MRIKTKKCLQELLLLTVKFQHVSTTYSFIKSIHDNDSYPLQEKQSGK